MMLHICAPEMLKPAAMQSKKKVTFIKASLAGETDDKRALEINRDGGLPFRCIGALCRHERSNYLLGFNYIAKPSV